MYLGWFGFFQVFGRRSETKSTKSDFGEKDQLPTAGVVKWIGSQRESGHVYRVGWATG